MSLHEDPKTAAEKFALHLEAMYGIQLDFARRQALISEIEEYGKAVAPVETPKQEKRNAKRRTR